MLTQLLPDSSPWDCSATKYLGTGRQTCMYWRQMICCMNAFDEILAWYAHILWVAPLLSVASGAPRCRTITNHFSDRPMRRPSSVYFASLSALVTCRSTQHFQLSKKPESVEALVAVVATHHYREKKAPHWNRSFFFQLEDFTYNLKSKLAKCFCGQAIGAKNDSEAQVDLSTQTCLLEVQPVDGMTPVVLIAFESGWTSQKITSLQSRKYDYKMKSYRAFHPGFSKGVCSL